MVYILDKIQLSFVLKFLLLNGNFTKKFLILNGNFSFGNFALVTLVRQGLSSALQDFCQGDAHGPGESGFYGFWGPNLGVRLHF